ncbi:hypothetical protein DEJ48_38505 [Streptomyces venezuelae]|uniref:Uncharacterized protein n=1 Tax=Streptomyces venezuelae TaxID=54571 RepID=A0A5P2CAX4_STRVZ|nr:hypothetical protein DEJ48_38505 [Streptomyces venezuelae]
MVRRRRGEPGRAAKGHIRTACSAAVRDPARDPGGALGEATEVRAGVHLRVASVPCGGSVL